MNSEPENESQPFIFQNKTMKKKHLIIELLLVGMIMLILLSIFLPKFFSVQRSAQLQTIKETLDIIGNYYADHSGILAHPDWVGDERAGGKYESTKINVIGGEIERIKSGFVIHTKQVPIEKLYQKRIIHSIPRWGEETAEFTLFTIKPIDYSPTPKPQSILSFALYAIIKERQHTGGDILNIGLTKRDDSNHENSKFDAAVGTQYWLDENGGLQPSLFALPPYDGSNGLTSIGYFRKTSAELGYEGDTGQVFYLE